MHKNTMKTIKENMVATWGGNEDAEHKSSLETGSHMPRLNWS